MIVVHKGGILFGKSVDEQPHEPAKHSFQRQALMAVIGALLAIAPPAFVAWLAVTRYGRLPIWPAVVAALSVGGFIWAIRRRRINKERRSLRSVTLIGIILSLPPVLLFWWLGQNRWTLAPYWLYIFLGLGLLAAAIDRLYRKDQPHHEATWIVFFLGLNASLHCLSGYAYLGGWALPVFLYFPAAFLYLFPDRPRRWRVLAGVIAALTAGFLMNLMFRQSLLIDEGYYCQRQRRFLPEYVHPIDGPTQCFDLAGVEGRGTALAGFSSVPAPYLLDLESLTMQQGESLSHGIRSVTPHPARNEWAVVPWENYGSQRHVVMVDEEGRIVGEAKGAGCKKPAQVAFHSNRMLLLCEESHSLHAFPASPPYAEEASLVLPGFRSHDLAIDAETGHAYVTDYGAWDLVEVDLAEFTVNRRTSVGWSTFGIVWGSMELLYLAQPMKNRVLAEDPHSLAEVFVIRTGNGPRALAFDSRRQLLFVGDYFTGDVEFFDPVQKRRLGGFYAGRLLRGLWLDVERDRLFVATGCGIRWINLQDLFVE